MQGEGESIIIISCICLEKTSHLLVAVVAPLHTHTHTMKYAVKFPPTIVSTNTMTSNNATTASAP